MNDDAQRQILRFGIRIEQTVTYHHNGHRYDNLNDALRYAEIDTNRDDESRRLSTQASGWYLHLDFVRSA